ncbi:MAG TPA: DUF4038 domain-containing protein [Verrucomicrobiota bacterium]|nr:DUF4038 domain-containing protein [Verrucomicrobiota bacterium]HQL77675.1 DUF4038 domain-containing protein [Verrucomicrobiota bacterium]
MTRNFVSTGPRLVALALLLLTAALPAVQAAAKLELVPKWDRFEHAFKSSVAYANAVQEVVLKVVFTSPLGEATEVEAFWDGGRTWRVRFSPDQPGRWSFRATCSDTANAGLHNQAGEFLCSAPIGMNPFRLHGPVRVARNHRHLEHADGTPFFWLADTVWDGARVAESRDWDFYAVTRARQGFTVAQWSVAPGEDARSQSAWTGSLERIAINPDFFQRLDARIGVLARAGLMSAIAPLLELQWSAGAAALPDSQAELLVRYIVARWGAEPVVWMLAFESDASASNLGRWKRIGQAVFGDRPRAPVVLFPGQTQWLLDEFRDEKWVDAFGYQSVTDVSDDALMWTVSGPFTTEWRKEPARPLIAFVPCENGAAPRSARRFGAADVRRAACWSLLLAPPAGISYCAEGLMNWDGTVGPRTAGETRGSGLPLWREALFLPGAEQVSHLAKFMDSIDYGALRPRARIVASQPGSQSPQRFIAGAGTDPNTLSVVYVPVDRTVELSPAALPASPLVGWFNPRTGVRQAVTARGARFTTPAPGDWLLLIQASR